MITTLAIALTFVQDTPQDIAKKDLPKNAVCTACTAMGEGHGAEKPAAGVMYKGTAYYFCSAKEVPAFKKSPDFYLPLNLPFSLDHFDLKDTAGAAWNVETLKGKVVLLDYWATWCKPCLALKPKLDAIRTKYKDRGFEMLSISIDEKKPALDGFLAKNRFENPVLWDDKQTWADLKILSIPAIFLVKDGKVIAQFRGTPKVADVEAAVKAALN